MALKYVKIASFEQLLKYGLLVVSTAATKIQAYPAIIQILIRIFPFTNAIYLSNLSYTSGLSSINLLILLVTNIILLALGLGIFNLFLKDSKNKGIVNSY